MSILDNDSSVNRDTNTLARLEAIEDSAVAEREVPALNPPFLSTLPENAGTDPNRVEGATEDEQGKIDEYKTLEAKVVDLAESTLDPRDMLKKYAKLGCEVLKLARKRKASLKPGSWNGKDDLNKVCDDLETLVKMRVAVKDVRMLVYARTFLWVEAVKPLVPNVERLSYHQVSHKFLPALSFDPVELTGEIKKDWIGFIRETVEIQLGDEPRSMSDIDSMIKVHKASIAKKAAAAVTDEKQLEREKKAAETKLRKDRRDAQSVVSDSLDKAITEGHADAKDVVEIVNAVLADHNLALPAKLQGFDPGTCTVADCKVLANTMAASGKLAEMKVLRDHLDVIIKIAENAMHTANRIAV